MPATGRLIGLPWSEAELILREWRLTHETRVTSPPGRHEAVGELRVVGVRPAGDALTVILSHRDYRRTGRDRPATTGGKPPLG